MFNMIPHSTAKVKKKNRELAQEGSKRYQTKASPSPIHLLAIPKIHSVHPLHYCRNRLAELWRR